MDLLPSFSSNVTVCHDTALNVAYRNLAQRRLRRSATGWTVDGHDLTLFHLSGFDPANTGRLSKHGTRFVQTSSGPLKAVMAHYRDQLLAAGLGAASARPDACGRSASGIAIPPLARSLFRQGRGQAGSNPVETFEVLLDSEAARRSGLDPALAGTATHRPARLGHAFAGHPVLTTVPKQKRQIAGPAIPAEAGGTLAEQGVSPAERGDPDRRPGTGAEDQRAGPRTPVPASAAGRCGRPCTACRSAS